MIATKIKVKINHFNSENIKRQKFRERKPEGEREREIEEVKFYSLWFDV